jgi:hypothetical protein
MPHPSQDSALSPTRFGPGLPTRCSSRPVAAHFTDQRLTARPDTRRHRPSRWAVAGASEDHRPANARDASARIRSYRCANLYRRSTVVCATRPLRSGSPGRASSLGHCDRGCWTDQQLPHASETNRDQQRRSSTNQDRPTTGLRIQAKCGQNCGQGRFLRGSALALRLLPELDSNQQPCD